MILNLLLESLIKNAIPIYCLIFGINSFCLFRESVNLKHLIIAITLFGLFIFLIRL